MSHTMNRTNKGRRGAVVRSLVTPLLVLLAAAPASATLLIYEGFDYTVGQRLVGQTNPYGTGWTDPTSPSQPGPGALPGFSQIDPQVIVAGDVAYPGTPLPTGDHFIVPRGVINAPANLTTQSNFARLRIPGAPHDAATTGNGTTGSLFFSFSMKLTNFVSLPSGTATGQAGNAAQQAGGWVTGFHWGDPVSGPGMGVAAAFGGNVRIRREVLANADTGNYEIGIAKNFSSTTLWDTLGSYAPNDTLYIVGEYQFVNAPVIASDDVFRLWINPTPGDPLEELTPTLVTNVGTDVAAGGVQAIRSFFYRSETATPGHLQVDELRIGTQFANVSVPEPGTFALVGMAAALFAVRRARRIA